RPWGVVSMRFAPRYMNFAHAGSRYLPFHSRLAPRLLALLLTSLAPLGAQMPPPAYDPAAQTAERQTREELDRVREQLRQQLPPSRPPPVIETAPPPQPVVQGDALRRPIQDLQIVGASQMPEKFSAYLTSRYADRDLNASDVEQLLGRDSAPLHFARLCDGARVPASAGPFHRDPAHPGGRGCDRAV